MSYLKRVGDFCSGFACFASLMWLLAEFMTYDAGSVGLTEKLVRFFDDQYFVEHALMGALVVMLVLSVVASILLKRLPYLTLLFSVPPLVLSVDMVRSEYIEDYPMLYVLFCGISVVSGIWECVERDRRDGGHRTAIAGDVVCAIGAGTCVLLWLTARRLGDVTPDNFDELNVFEYEITRYSADMDVNLFLIFACVFVALIAVSLILTDVYFIDTLLTFISCVAVIYLWSADKWTVHAEVIATVAIAALITRLIPTLSGGKKHRDIQ